MSEVSKVPNTVLLIKDQRACVNNWSKAMHVGGVKSSVCGFYITLHTEYCYSCRRCQRLLYTVASRLCQEGRLFEPSVLGVWLFAGSKGYVCWRCRKCIQGPQYRVMLLMSKVSKVALPRSRSPRTPGPLRPPPRAVWLGGPSYTGSPTHVLSLYLRTNKNIEVNDRENNERGTD